MEGKDGVGGGDHAGEEGEEAVGAEERQVEGRPGDLGQGSGGEQDGRDLPPAPVRPRDGQELVHVHRVGEEECSEVPELDGRLQVLDIDRICDISTHYEGFINCPMELVVVIPKPQASFKCIQIFLPQHLQLLFINIV